MMTDTQILENLLEKACSLPPAEIPDFLADLERIRSTAWARLSAPAPASVVKPIDRLLDVKEAAALLNVHPSHLYHHVYPFTRRTPETRRLRFSLFGIQEYIRNGK